jgi:hypothetical protein
MVMMLAGDQSNSTSTDITRVMLRNGPELHHGSSEGVSEHAFLPGQQLILQARQAAKRYWVPVLGQLSVA